jgi:hypothetical protein
MSHELLKDTSSRRNGQSIFSFLKPLSPGVSPAFQRRTQSIEYPDFTVLDCARRDNGTTCVDRDLFRPDKEAHMRINRTVTIIALGLSLSIAGHSVAQQKGGQQDATQILNSMPPEQLAKVQALAQILQQGIKDGKLTEAEIQQGLLSGQLREKLKQLSPEAGQLLEEISDATKQGKGPGEESVAPLLGELGISPN